MKNVKEDSHPSSCCWDKGGNTYNVSGDEGTGHMECTLCRKPCDYKSEVKTESKVVKEQLEPKKSRKGLENNPQNINRAGAPPKTHWWTQLYMDELERDSEKMKGLKKREVVVRSVVHKAENGDMVAVKEIGDRVQGKSPQAIGVLGDDGAFEAQPFLLSSIIADADEE